MNNRGFISTYFLVLLMIMTAGLSIAVTNEMNQIETQINVSETNQYLLSEAQILSYIRCQIKNEELEEGTYVYCGNQFRISKSAYELTVEIYSPISETILIEMREERIYDYRAIRNIKRDDHSSLVK